jgi:putative ABC transport system ATP-binding protein
MSGPAITVRGVVKDFGSGQTAVRALHGIDAQIAPGELTFLVGESGSGKTTLISIIAGIMYPTEGTVRVFGTEIYDLSENKLVKFRLRNIGFIFQQYNLIPTLSSAENASVPLVRGGAARAGGRAGARTLAGSASASSPIGCRGRCRAGSSSASRSPARSSTNPRLVVCDEPTAALDAASGRKVMDLLREVALDQDRAVIIVTHDNRVFDLADRILDMEDGRIVKDERPTKQPTEGAPH